MRHAAEDTCIMINSNTLLVLIILTLERIECVQDSLSRKAKSYEQKSKLFEVRNNLSSQNKLFLPDDTPPPPGIHSILYCWTFFIMLFQFILVEVSGGDELDSHGC